MNKLEQAARQAFETWWEREGQEFLFALNTTTDDDIKLVAEIAWKNGAYCAEQAEQEPVACPICGNGYLVKHTEEYCNSCGSVCVSPQTIQENVANKKAAPVRTKDLTDTQKVDNQPVINALIEAFNVVMASESRDQALNEIENLATSIRTGIHKEKSKC